MNTLRLKKLTRARMEQWLREHPTRKFKCDSATNCPIAHYILDMYKGIERTTIGYTTGIIRSGAGGKTIHLPLWVKKFVQEVDRGKKVGDKITARAALKLLQSI